MPDFLHWSTFLGATIVLLLIPGPSVIYVVTRGMEHGYRGVVFSSIGLALGDLLQVLCTVLGLSAVLASSSVVFGIVKYAGAGYLIVLGLRRMLARGANTAPKFLAAEHADQETSRSLVKQAFFALNPKTAIFFLALFPQFVAQNAGPPWFQILLFGCAFVVLGFITNSLYGFLGGTLGAIGNQNQRFQMASRCISGVVLIGMGIAAALASVPHKPI